ncbi:hypothetical protein Unana1_05824 [Umbelopsis nana]
MSTQVIPVAVASPSDGEKTTASTAEPPQPRQSSKAILRKALALANDAVLSDTANNVENAVAAYSEAVRLLDIVLKGMENESDKAKLNEIHSTYSERIRLLSKINTPVPPTPDLNTTLTTPSDPKVGPPSPVPQEESVNDTTSDGDEHTVRTANIVSPVVPIVQPSISTPAPGKSSARRKTNQRSTSFSEAANARVSVFNIPPPPPFQPPQQLKEAAKLTRPQHQLSLDIPRITTIRKKPSTELRSAPVKPVDHSLLGNLNPVPLDSTATVVNDQELVMDDPVRTLASVLSESPTDLDLSTPPPPSFTSAVSKSPQHLTPPPRTHSIIGGHTIPRARKSSLLASNIYRTPSHGTDDSETNATQAFIRLTGQRAPAEVLRMGSADSEERFDRAATIKAFSLMRSLELSMTVGCHITKRLYVPKNLWYQPNIRLPSVDVKVSVCETLLMALARLEAWHRLEDVKGTLSQLNALETSLETAQLSLSRKLGIPRSRSDNSITADEPEIYRKETQVRKHQSIIAWGSKFTKSVERMNAFNLAKSSDDPHQYVDTLVRLFQSVHILDTWLRHYHSLLMDPHHPSNKKPQLEAMVQKLGKICNTLHTTVCSFVIRDLSIMLGKWVKRGGGWVGE